MPPRRRSLNSVTPLRFAAAWRLELDKVGDALGPHLTPAPEDPTAADDALRVDLIRPWDLVALSVAFTGCELVAGGASPPAVRPHRGSTGRMFVDHAFQHGYEEAVYESTAKAPLERDGKPDPGHPQSQDPAGARPHPPVGFRPARASRLVFTIATDDVIEFSTAGILAAMSRLELVVHPLATPGTAPTVGRTGALPEREFRPHFLHLGDGLIMVLDAQSPVIEKATQAFLRSNPAPDVTTTAGLLAHQQNLRLARAEAVRAVPTVKPGTRIPDHSIFAPGRGLVPDLRGPQIRPRRTLSRPPTLEETSIEAPYRLIVSPGAGARWAHAATPAAADDAPEHVELWHTRLAGPPADDDEPPDERDDKNRIIRALWARDRDWAGDQWRDGTTEKNVFAHTFSPDPTHGPGFRGSLDRLDRHMLVRQSAETWPGKSGTIAPVPVGADALWLSGLGAWLDLHGAWTTLPYSEVQLESILSWDHVAPMGRDQFVRVVYPGYLYPFGHQTALVKITERKMKDTVHPVAGLYQRMFLVVGERSRNYTNRDLPFTRVRVRPTVSPNLDPLSESSGDSQSSFFWPRVAGSRFPFILDAVDHAGRPIRLNTPLMWVAESFSSAQNRAAVDAAYAGDPSRRVTVQGQNLAYVTPAPDGPDVGLDTEAVWLLGKASLGSSTPRLSAATATVPAVEQISSAGRIPFAYHPTYVTDGLGAPSIGDVWALIREGAGGEEASVDPTAPLPQLRFGAGAPTGSDGAGGFLAPDLPIRALSLGTGPVGDVGSAAAGGLNPAAFLAGALPKLFGLIDLSDLIASAAALPSIVTETVGRVTKLINDLALAAATATEAVTEAQKQAQRAQGKSAALQAQAQQALTQAQALATDAESFAQDFGALLNSLTTADVDQIEAQLGTARASLQQLADRFRALAELLPPQAAIQCRRIGALLDEAGQGVDLAQDLFDSIQGLDPANLTQSFSFEWKPALQNWPASFPIFALKPGSQDNLTLAVHGQLSGQGHPEVVASAELRDFHLNLFGNAPLMRIPFDHMFFKSGSTGKPEVDVVLGDLEFLGILGFVERIKELIPFDGFSDPPYVEVTTEGATAGFTLALPNVAVGVFNLSNMSLAADVSVPFLGKSVTVGFSFCSRERPFRLTVMCLGGGGWFLVRIAPDGLDVLEVGLEATAALAVDFGVASGSISASVGIYIRLEGEQGSLTGYFRLRGEVDVLGLISASIELYMELVYQFDTGKMLGRATITVEVEVLIFSGTVKISAERQLAGSNGDPSFREVLGAEQGTSDAWNEYCLAFAAEE
ncbi:hypothetical protein [Nocardioides limicola]|uniref:hypothetical protein n=1 Tax=Nocardioides limicola TaxID=2803368 RepID=UPI00193B997E|nr:hypothetical protein [Nocardioides sp. DJM-14]